MATMYKHLYDRKGNTAHPRLEIAQRTDHEISLSQRQDTPNTQILHSGVDIAFVLNIRVRTQSADS